VGRMQLSGEHNSVIV